MRFKGLHDHVVGQPMYYILEQPDWPTGIPTAWYAVGTFMDALRRHLASGGWNGDTTIIVGQLGAPRPYLIALAQREDGQYEAGVIHRSFPPCVEAAFQRIEIMLGGGK